MFKARGILPQQLAKQDPKLLFDMLKMLTKENQPSMNNVPDDMKWFYGY